MTRVYPRPAAGAAPRVDGRFARAERTRRAIVEAHLALIEEGDLKPTGERIADRAGVSLRTLWTNFKDMETLLAATGEHVTRQQEAMVDPIAPDLPLARRVSQFCAQRVRMLEALGPSARAARLKEPFSENLRLARSRSVGRLRAQVAEVFAPELARAGADGDDVVLAVTVVTTWASWSVLREDLGLDPGEAGDIMRRTVAALISAAAEGHREEWS